MQVRPNTMCREPLAYAAGPTPGPSKPASSTPHGAMSAVAGAFPNPCLPRAHPDTSLENCIKSSTLPTSSFMSLTPATRWARYVKNVVDYIRKEKAHKQIVYLINKVELVPGWVTVSSFSVCPLVLFMLCYGSPTPLTSQGRVFALLSK